MLQKFNPKNKHLKIWVGNQLFDRENAKVSVFDSSVQGGDAVWEGLRLYNGRIFKYTEHLKRLLNSAKALQFENIQNLEFIKIAIKETILANDMKDGVHIGLTLTRGEKITSGMDPRLNQNEPILIVLAEYKEPVYNNNGISLITSHIRRNNPEYLDSKIHHNNLLNNILAKISANVAGADDAIMLDSNGFVSETNATNIFLIKNNTLFTPFADSCLPGITRKVVLDICDEAKVSYKEKNLSLTEFYTADEVFVSGTMGELTRVNEIDGRKIENSQNYSKLEELQKLFYAYVERHAEQII